jgi:hypothetical protein
VIFFDISNVYLVHIHLEWKWISEKTATLPLRPCLAELDIFFSGCPCEVKTKRVDIFVRTHHSPGQSRAARPLLTAISQRLCHPEVSCSACRVEQPATCHPEVTAAAGSQSASPPWPSSPGIQLSLLPTSPVFSCKDISFFFYPLLPPNCSALSFSLSSLRLSCFFPIWAPPNCSLDWVPRPRSSSSS